MGGGEWAYCYFFNIRACTLNRGFVLAVCRDIARALSSFCMYMYACDLKLFPGGNIHVRLVVIVSNPKQDRLNGH